jgi:hypothetical protein
MSAIQDILQPVLSSLQSSIIDDPEFTSATNRIECSFSVTSSDNPSTSILVSISNGKASFDIGPASTPSFAIQARPEDWKLFFSEHLERPYQSYWGVLRVLGHNDGVGVLGDQRAFGKYARVWRIVLDRARDAVLQRKTKVSMAEPPLDEVSEDECVTGKYTWINHSEYGKVKLFYEFAGDGPLTVLFLHTAGSDSRQYHSLMNVKQLQERCTMYALDLPAHGRSSLGSRQSIEGYALTETSYLESIGQFIKKLKLKNTVVCGASMAGHVCLAAAIKARELNIRGSIPCEGCDHLPFSQPIYEISGSDTSLLDPERVCGMCSPTSPEYYKRQIWWQYSSQGYGIFSGMENNRTITKSLTNTGLPLNRCRRPQILLSRLGRTWSNRKDRYEVLSCLYADRRIRLFLHYRGQQSNGGQDPRCCV